MSGSTSGGIDPQTLAYLMALSQQQGGGAAGQVQQLPQQQQGWGQQGQTQMQMPSQQLNQQQGWGGIPTTGTGNSLPFGWSPYGGMNNVQSNAMGLTGMSPLQRQIMGNAAGQQSGGQGQQSQMQGSQGLGGQYTGLGSYSPWFAGGGSSS